MTNRGIALTSVLAGLLGGFVSTNVLHVWDASASQNETQTFDSIRVKDLQLIDPSGNVIARLTNDNGAVFTLSGSLNRTLTPDKKQIDPNKPTTQMLQLTAASVHIAVKGFGAEGTKFSASTDLGAPIDPTAYSAVFGYQDDPDHNGKMEIMKISPSILDISDKTVPYTQERGNTRLELEQITLQGRDGAAPMTKVMRGEIKLQGVDGTLKTLK